MELKDGSPSQGIGYASAWTRIFRWLELDLSGEISEQCGAHALINEVTIRQMGRNPRMPQEPQAQGHQGEAQAEQVPPPQQYTLNDIMAQLQRMDTRLERIEATQKEQDTRIQGIEEQQMEQWYAIERYRNSQGASSSRHHGD